MQIVPSSTKKVENLRHCRKLMQIRCQKGLAQKCINVSLGLFTLAIVYLKGVYPHTKAYGGNGVGTYFGTLGG